MMRSKQETFDIVVDHLSKIYEYYGFTILADNLYCGAWKDLTNLWKERIMEMRQNEAIEEKLEHSKLERVMVQS